MLLIKPGIWSSVIAEDPDFIQRLKYRLELSDVGFRPDPNKKYIFYKEVIPGFRLDIPTGILNSHVLPYFYFETIFDLREQSYKIIEPQIIINAFNRMAEIDPTFEVRPHQVAATVKCLARKHGICECPTGSGKTEIISALCTLISGKILIINSRTSILTQIKERLALRGVKRKVENLTQKTDINNTDILVSTNNLLYNKIKSGNKEFFEYLKSLRAIIIDECHHASSMTHILPILLSEPEYLIGFTASKHKYNGSLDDLIINALFGDSIYFVSSQYLREMGYLATIYACYFDYPKKTGIKKHYKNPSAEYDDLITNNYQRNEKIIKITSDLIKNDLKVTLFVSRLEHGKFFVEEFKQRGIRALFFCGGDMLYEATNELDENNKYIVKGRKGSVNEIKEALQKDCDLVIGNVVMNEGIDIPAFDAGVLVDAGKSVISYIQRIGRICRQKRKGLNEALFVDFNDISNKTVQKWTAERQQYLKNEGIQIINESQFYEFMKKIGNSRNG